MTKYNRDWPWSVSSWLLRLGETSNMYWEGKYSSILLEEHKWSTFKHSLGRSVKPAPRQVDPSFTICYWASPVSLCGSDLSRPQSLQNPGSWTMDLESNVRSWDLYDAMRMRSRQLGDWLEKTEWLVESPRFILLRKTFIYNLFSQMECFFWKMNIKKITWKNALSRYFCLFWCGCYYLHWSRNSVEYSQLYGWLVGCHER